MRSTTYRFLVDLGAGLPLISEDPGYWSHGDKVGDLYSSWWD